VRLHSHLVRIVCVMLLFDPDNLFVYVFQAEEKLNDCVRQKNQLWLEKLYINYFSSFILHCYDKRLINHPLRRQSTLSDLTKERNIYKHIYASYLQRNIYVPTQRCLHVGPIGASCHLANRRTLLNLGTIFKQASIKATPHSFFS
jgi:hypothetical protein